MIITNYLFKYYYLFLNIIKLFMKKKFTVLVALLAFGFGLSSCEKEKDSDPDKSALIVGKNWKMTAATTDNQDVYMSFYEECERDNIMTFTSNGDYKIVEGATKCDPSAPNTYEEGSWSITGDKLTTLDDAFPFPVEFDILQLDNKTLKVSLEEPFFNSGQTTIVTYTAQ